MLISPLKISPLSSGRGGSAPVHLNSALHEWNYQNATDIGTTVTMVDTGSVGGLNMTNPDAASKPTLNANGVTTDGVSEYLSNNVANFRSGDTTGVLHCLVNVENANSFILASTDSAQELKFFGGRYVAGGNLRLQKTDPVPANSKELETTAGYSGYKVLSFVQDSSQASIFVEGVKIASYSSATLTTEWFLSGTTNISIGSLIRLTPVYYALTLKYLAYCPYIDDATVIVEQNKILNSNL